MSKSLKRVKAVLQALAVDHEVLEMQVETRTAQQAADAAKCDIDQIAKSIIFRTSQTDAPVLFITAGGNQVDHARAEALIGEPLLRADAAFVRAKTGFAIGGVAPLGHLVAPHCHFDRRLLDFPTIWAAAGTPRHIFSIPPATLRAATDAQISDFIK